MGGAGGYERIGITVLWLRYTVMLSVLSDRFNLIGSDCQTTRMLQHSHTTAGPRGSGRAGCPAANSFFRRITLGPHTNAVINLLRRHTSAGQSITVAGSLANS
jgi:hypothetical protein